jgi:hypothetical protein
MRDVLIAENLPDGKLYWNIAERTILPQLEKDHELVLEAGRTVQKTINDGYGYGVRIPRTKLDVKRAEGIMNMACADGANIEAVLNEPVITMARSAYDTFQQTNLEEMEQLGVDGYVHREYDGVGLHDGKDACQWCMERAGTYEDYSAARDAGAFERHDGCGCTVEVIYKSGRIQDPWTKAEYRERTIEARAAAIEERRQEMTRKAEESGNARAQILRAEQNKGKTERSAWQVYFNQKHQ